MSKRLVQLGPRASVGQAGEWRMRTLNKGTQVVADDIMIHRFRLQFLSPVRVRLVAVSITAKVKPLSSDYEADQLVSDDAGDTWNSIYAPSTLILPAGEQNVLLTPTFAVPYLNIDDQMRLDVKAADGIVSGIEILLLGVIEEVVA